MLQARADRLIHLRASQRLLHLQKSHADEGQGVLVAAIRNSREGIDSTRKTQPQRRAR